MIKTIIALPDWEILHYDAKRIRNSISLNLPGTQLHFIANKEWSDTHAKNFEEIILHLDECIDSSEIDNLICFEKIFDEVSGVVSRLKINKKRTNIYRFLLNRPYLRARLEYIEGPLSSELHANDGLHIFERIHNGKSDQFCYFPYNYMFRQNGVGPLNEFGMRITKDSLELVKRDPDLILIIVFGGSAAWSLDCLHNEMFTYKLEQNLNEFESQLNTNRKYLVLNMAQHGNVVLNELISYILFAEKLKPDYVIGHDGFNDIAYGVSNDQYLLQNCKIAYQSNLEEWAQILSGNKSYNSTYKDQVVHSLRNPPNAVITSYLERKKQFARIVENNETRFIFGIQPFLKSKKSLHKKENEYLEYTNALNIGPQALAYQKMHEIMDLLTTQIPISTESTYVNFHEKFRTYGEDKHLFVDFVHTTPLAEEIIALEYANIIRSIQSKS